MSDFVEGATTPETKVEPGSTETLQETTDTVEELANWVGEGKKYKDANELAKAYRNADQRLEVLKLETERLRIEKEEAVSKSRSVDEILAALREDKEQQTPESKPPAELPDFDKLFETKMTERESKAKQKELVDSTWKIMDDAFGDRAAASMVVKAYIGDDPVKKAAVNSLAISDPVGLLKLLGKDVEKKDVSFVDGKHKSNSQNIDIGSKLTWDVAHAHRKSDPKLYYSHAFRKRMLEEL